MLNSTRKRDSQDSDQSTQYQLDKHLGIKFSPNNSTSTQYSILAPIGLVFALKKYLFKIYKNIFLGYVFLFKKIIIP